MKKSSVLSIALKMPKSFEQLTIEQLYSGRLQEKHCLQGADLEKAAHLLLDRYLLNTPTEK